MSSRDKALFFQEGVAVGGRLGFILAHKLSFSLLGSVCIFCLFFFGGHWLA